MPSVYTDAKGYLLQSQSHAQTWLVGVGQCSGVRMIWEGECLDSAGKTTVIN